MKRALWRNFFILFILNLAACQGSCGSGALSAGAADTTDTSSQAAATGTVSGAVTLPALGTANLSRLRGLARGGAAQAVSGTVPAPAGTLVEILDADMDLVATTTTGENGTFTLDVDTAMLIDAAGDGYVFFLRATSDSDGDGAVTAADTASLMMTVTADVAGEASGADLSGYEVDTEATLVTMLAFAGSSFNPLTATGAEAFPDNLDLEYLTQVNGTLVSSAGGLLGETADPGELNGQTMDEALAIMLLSFYALGGDGNSLYDLVNFEAGSAEAASLEAALAGVPELAGFDPGVLDACDASLEALDGTLDVWATSPAFLGYLDADAAGLDIFLEAALSDKTLTEFQALNASAELLEMQLAIWDDIDFSALGGVDAGVLAGSLGELFDPEIVLAMAGDADVAGAIQALTSGLFAGGADFDPQLVDVMADACAAKADDAAYWDLFAGEAGVDAAALDNLVAYFDLAIETQDFSGYFAGESLYDWDALMGAVDVAEDYSTWDAASFTAASASVFETAAMAIDPLSCEHFCGSAAPGGCFCDDACAQFGDCCADKPDVCGENYLDQLFAQYGYEVPVAPAEESGALSATLPEGSTATSESATVSGGESSTGGESASGGESIASGESGGEDPDDVDGDGVPDFLDNCPTVANPGQEDSGTIGADGNPDGIGDVCVDFDADGVYDVNDNCYATANPGQEDANADGIGTACDSDDDGTINMIDNCVDVANPGQEDTHTVSWDHLPDGIGDACFDYDGDGVFDDQDNCVLYANADQADSNADGVGDVCNDEHTLGTDDGDNDTVTDEVDSCVSVFNPTQEDWDIDGFGDACDDFDSDGLFDSADNCVGMQNVDQADDDDDGIGNACDDDYDPDGDGYAEYIDNCPGVSNPDQIDSGFNGPGDLCDDYDEDGVIDAFDNCMLYGNADQADVNADGVGDVCEGPGANQDPDNDYMPNQFDNCPGDANNNQDDDDGDGYGDVCDNCANVENFDQADLNADGTGDVCVEDNDADAVLDGIDNCPGVSNPDQNDCDADGDGNQCDASSDCDDDDINDAVDNCPGVFNPHQADFDSDGAGDVCDAEPQNPGVQ